MLEMVAPKPYFFTSDWRAAGTVWESGSVSKIGIEVKEQARK
jgi:hypothetical protein